MKRVLKGGLFISFVYLLAVFSTLLIADRVAELDSKDLRNNNNAVAIKIG